MPLEVGDQGRTEMTERLLARIDGGISAKQIERLRCNAERAPVGGGADHAGTRQSLHHTIDRRVHRPGIDDLIADQAAVRLFAIDAPFVLDRLPRDAVADKARQPQIGHAGNDAFLARGQGQECGVRR